MKLYRNYPVASDRMGMIWALNGINDACIIEFGPAGTTHFSIEGLMQFGVNIEAKTFTTHLDEHDVTFGNEDRIIDAILEIDAIEKPKYIFVVGSSITSIIGIDLESVKYQVQDEVESKIIVLPDCDFQSEFTKGIEDVLTILIKEITLHQPNIEKKPYYNILGLGIHDYNQSSDLHEIKRLMKNYFGLELGTTFILNTTLKDIKEASKSIINIVIHKEGEKAAKLLQKTYNQPYVELIPYGVQGTKKWIEQIGESLNMEINNNIFIEEINKIIYKENMLKRRIAKLDNKKIIISDASPRYNYLSTYLTYLGFEIVKEFHEPLLRFTNGIEALHSRDVIQITHPSFNQESDYPHTPMIGYRGAYYLIQVINNKLTLKLNNI